MHMTRMLAIIAASAALALCAYTQNPKTNDHARTLLVGAATPSSYRASSKVVRSAEVSVPATCRNRDVNPQVREALRLACDRPISDITARSADRVIVIGFLGGFVRAHESNHPEVWFGSYLRERYTAATDVATYSNHEESKALSDVLRMLDTNHDGVLSVSEERQAKIILYGHSWGASEVTSFARDLEEHGVPVLLTVQIDIVRKPGQQPTRIPPNVKAAVNLFQSEGLLHGRSEIVAEDPESTEIIGNLHMTYHGRHVDCRNYPLLPRTFNKPHHEIENDPRVWNQIATLIDSHLSIPTASMDLP